LTVKINWNCGTQQEICFNQKIQKKQYHFNRNFQFRSVM